MEIDKFVRRASPCAPSTTRAAPALSATESGNRNGSLSRESITSIAGMTMSTAASTPAADVDGGIVSPMRKAISARRADG